MRIIALALLCAACGGQQVGVCEEMNTPHSIKKFSGLTASSNTVGDATEGAADLMDNAVLRSRNLLESRRGYKASAATTGPINALAFKEGCAIAITYDTPSTTGALRYYTPATNVWTTLPMNPGGLTLDRPGISGARTRFVSANKALYFQSKYGLTKVEALSSGVSRAALHPKYVTQTNTPGPVSFSTLQDGGSGTGAWLPNNTAVAYRITLARKGANQELIESEPSDRLLFSNTSGVARLISVVAATSWFFDSDAFVRIWRDKSAATSTDPSDEMFLIKELTFPSFLAGPDATGYLNPGSSFSSGTVTYSDITTDTSLYVPLYTNPNSGTGIASANASAPLSADMAWFRSRLHLLNTSDVQRLTVKIIGTGTGGIQDGDSFTLNGQRFYFRTTVSTTPPEIQLFTAGTAAQNIENTARQMVKIINASQIAGYAGGSSGILVTKFVAYYVSSTSIDAGQIVIQSLVPGAPAFSFQTSSSSGFANDYSAGTTSDPNAQAAGWMWSNLSQPEGVPTSNNNPIGDFTAAGQRLIALKETLFAFKQDGLWKITDDGSQLGPQLQLVDPTIRLVAPETAVALDNFILALADQGVILITETGGVLNISHTQIERELFKLMAYVGASRLAETAFGVAYQPEHTYILCLPESPNATSCSVQYVYNLQTQTWDRWALPGLTSGAVHPDTGQLYFGRSDGTLWIERKAMDNSDYQDPGFTIASPTATQTASLVFSGDLRTGATPFAVGDIVQQWQAINALAQRVTAVAYSSTNNQTTVTLDKAPRYAWNQIVPLTIIKAIQCSVRFLPFHAGEPLTDKNWDTAYLSFRYCDLDFLSVGWSSEKYPITATAIERVNNADGSSNAPINLETWGSGTWGSKIWGRQTRDVLLKCTIPQDFDHSAQLTLSLLIPCALQRFELNAIDVKISGASDKTVR